MDKLREYQKHSLPKVRLAATRGLQQLLRYLGEDNDSPGTGRLSIEPTTPGQLSSVEESADGGLSKVE